eukprot:6199526-Pleurochrysis_carterae.AAC.1
MLWAVWQPCSAFLVSRPAQSAPPPPPEHINGECVHARTQRGNSPLVSELLFHLQTYSTTHQVMGTSLCQSIRATRSFCSVDSCIAAGATNFLLINAGRGIVSHSSKQRGTDSHISNLATSSKKMRSHSQSVMMRLRPGEPPPAESFDPWQPL